MRSPCSTASVLTRRGRQPAPRGAHRSAELHIVRPSWASPQLSKKRARPEPNRAATVVQQLKIMLPWRLPDTNAWKFVESLWLQAVTRSWKASPKGAWLGHVTGEFLSIEAQERCQSALRLSSSVRSRPLTPTNPLAVFVSLCILRSIPRVSGAPCQPASPNQHQAARRNNSQPRRAARAWTLPSIPGCPAESTPQIHRDQAQVHFVPTNRISYPNLFTFGYP